MRPSWNRATYLRWIATVVLALLVSAEFPQCVAAQQSDHIGQAFVRVRDRASEELLAQVHIQLVRFPDGIVGEQFTGTDGAVQFSGISVGAYTIRALCQGYQPGEARVDFRKGDGSLQNVDIPLVRHEQGKNQAPEGTVAANSLRIPDDARKEFERGRLLLNEKKDPRGSIGPFQRAIAIYPDYADAHFMLGTAQIQINAAAEAETSLRKAIALDERMSAAYYPLAVLLFGQKRFAEEQTLLERARELHAGDWRWPYEQARCEAQQGHWEPALKYGMEASRNDNAPPRVHLLLADILANSGKPREAVNELELFSKLDPQSPYMLRVKEVLPILRQRAAESPAPH